MNVLVVGANGQIGQHVVELLKKEGKHTPIAFLRKQEQVDDFEGKGVEARLGNLEETVDDIKDKMGGIEAVVFTAGSGGSTGYDKTLLIDLDGAIKVMEAAAAEGIDRFVMVSALGADNRETWSDEIKPYYAAKHYADWWLIDSKLNYTIVRPGGLKNEDSKDTVKMADAITKADDYSVPRVDVARVIAASLDNENSFRQAFDLTTGDTSIDDALNQL